MLKRDYMAKKSKLDLMEEQIDNDLKKRIEPMFKFSKGTLGKIDTLYLGGVIKERGYKHKTILKYIGVVDNKATSYDIIFERGDDLILVYETEETKHFRKVTPTEAKAIMRRRLE